MPKFGGKTEDAGAPILGAKYWKKGLTLSGKVVRSFPTVNGDCYELFLDKDITVKGELVSPEEQQPITGRKFSVGNMKGFNMAVAACGLQCLLPGDKIKITCTGSTDTGKGNERVNFALEVERN